MTCGDFPPNGNGIPAPCTVTSRVRTKLRPEVREVLFRETLAGQCQLNDGHRGGAVVENQRRCLAGRHLFEKRLRDRGYLRIGRGDIGRRMEVDLDDAERGVRIRLDMLDIVHRGRERALERGDDAPRHLIRAADRGIERRRR